MSVRQPSHLRWPLSPTSRLGRWSVGLLGLCVASFVVMCLVVAAGERGDDAIFDNWLLAGPGLIAA